MTAALRCPPKWAFPFHYRSHSCCAIDFELRRAECLTTSREYDNNAEGLFRLFQFG